MHGLFVYGTLRNENIRFKLTGKRVTTTPGILKGFVLDTIIQDNHEYPIIMETGIMHDTIVGEVVPVDKNDLIILDEYEGKEYIRRLVFLADGSKAWVYAK